MKRVILLAASLLALIAAALALRSVPSNTGDAARDENTPEPRSAAAMAPAEKRTRTASVPTSLPDPGSVPNDPLPLVDFAKNRDALEALARAGRADAARRLGEVLTGCRYHVAKTLDDVERESLQRLAPEAPDDTDAEARRIAEQIDYQNMMLALCDGATGIDDADVAEGYDWMILAANLGDPIAMAQRYDIELQKIGFGDGEVVDAADDLLALQPIAMQMLSRAAATGEPVAMARLARAHAIGVLAEKDPVRAQAYVLAAVEAARRRGWRSPNVLIGTRQLTDAEREDAERLAHDILQRCCGGTR